VRTSFRNLITLYTHRKESIKHGTQEHCYPRCLSTHSFPSHGTSFQAALQRPKLTYILAGRQRRNRNHHRTPQRRTPLHHNRHHAPNIILQTTSYHHPSHCRLHVLYVAPSRVTEPRRSSKLHHRRSHSLRAIQTHHRRRGRCRRQALLRQRIRRRDHPRGVQETTGSFCWR